MEIVTVGWNCQRLVLGQSGLKPIGSGANFINYSFGVKIDV